MFPIVLDVRKVKIALVGGGPSAQRRLAQLRESGAENLTHYAEALPGEEDLCAAQIVYIADIDESDAERLAGICRENNVLVNVEDVNRLCDFYTPSVVRRGDLLVSVSTGGKSPGLAQMMRGRLEKMFGSEWESRLEVLAKARLGWRDSGDDMKTVAAKTREMIEREGWL